MALSVRLRLFERIARIVEIGAGILPVGIEEEVIERVRQVVVMGDVLARFPKRIVLPEDAQPAADDIAEFEDRMRRRKRHVTADQLEQIVDARILDGEAAVHEGLAELQRRVQEELAHHRAIMETDSDGLPRLLSGEDMHLVIGINDRAACRGAADGAVSAKSASGQSPLKFLRCVSLTTKLQAGGSRKGPNSALFREELCS